MLLTNVPHAQAAIASARSPIATSPDADPICSQRAAAASTPAIRSGRRSSSVTQAMSEPLANAQPTPQTICVATRAGKAVTSPVTTMLMPISIWEITSAHLRLIVSATTPAGTSTTIEMIP